MSNHFLFMSSIPSNSGSKLLLNKVHFAMNKIFFRISSCVIFHYLWLHLTDKALLFCEKRTCDMPNWWPNRHTMAMLITYFTTIPQDRRYVKIGLSRSKRVGDINYLKRGPAPSTAGRPLRLRHNVVSAPASALMLVFVARHSVTWKTTSILTSRL